LEHFAAMLRTQSHRWRDMNERLLKIKEISHGISAIINRIPEDHACINLARTAEQLSFAEATSQEEYLSNIRSRMFRFKNSLGCRRFRIDSLLVKKTEKISAVESIPTRVNTTLNAPLPIKRSMSDLYNSDSAQFFIDTDSSNSAQNNPPQTCVKIETRSENDKNEVSRSNWLEGTSITAISNQCSESFPWYDGNNSNTPYYQNALSFFLSCQGILERFILQAQKFMDILKEKQAVLGTPHQEIYEHRRKIEQYVNYCLDSLSYIQKCRQGHTPTQSTLDGLNSAISKIEAAFEKINRKVIEYEDSKRIRWQSMGIQNKHTDIPTPQTLTSSENFVSSNMKTESPIPSKVEGIQTSMKQSHTFAVEAPEQTPLQPSLAFTPETSVENLEQFFLFPPFKDEMFLNKSDVVESSPYNSSQNASDDDWLDEHF